MSLAISCHRSKGKTPYCIQWGVLCKNQWQDMACKNGGYCKLSAGRPPSMVLRGSPFDPVKNSNEKTCYSLEGWENGRKEMACVCTGWSACSHSSLALSFQDSQRKIHRKSQMLEKSLYSLDGKQVHVTTSNSTRQPMWEEPRAPSSFVQQPLAHILPSASEASLAHQTREKEDSKLPGCSL